MSSALRIGIVAGETSGDLLASRLMVVIKQRIPNVTFVGVAGPLMLAEGCESLYPMESLSVMGLVEILGHLPRLLKIRKNLCQYFKQNPPDVFIGVDFPGFNLSLATKLKRFDIPTVHYVSPTVWAWRRWRIHKIAKSIDLMLTLFPFEADFYNQHHIPVKFVGHPLADMIPLNPDRAAIRKQFQLATDQLVIALLPGSRSSELSYLTDSFIQTAIWCLQQQPHVQFMVPLANQKQYDFFQQKLQNYQTLPITLFIGQARDVMLVSDVVLLASGTATLEALLLKRPMVVAYRISPLSFKIAKYLVKIPYVSLPNLLTKQCLVPEFIQDQVIPEKMGAAVLYWLTESEQKTNLQPKFSEIHQQLRQDASQQAAHAVLELLDVAV